MKYLIWGTGPYCREKIIYNFRGLEDEIVCFIDREKGEFLGKKVILPSEISLYQFDKIVVMSSHFLEIIQEMVKMGIESSVIIPGIAFSPLWGEELSLMTNNSRIDVLEDGSLNYIIDSHCINIRHNNDWEKVKNLICAEDNVEKIKGLSINPVGRLFGLDRGGAIDRYYIDEFLKTNAQYIKGRVLEMEEDIYTKKFGAHDSISYIFKYGNERGFKGNDLYGDLQSMEGLPLEYFDCIIFTQVFNCIYDIQSAIQNSLKMLKKGGVLLATVSGNSPISRYDMDRWGYYWNFTDKSVEMLFSGDSKECVVYPYGNCKTACAFLQGMSYKELSKEELDYYDRDYPLVICVCVKNN